MNKTPETKFELQYYCCTATWGPVLCSTTAVQPEWCHLVCRCNNLCVSTDVSFRIPGCALHTRKTRHVPESGKKLGLHCSGQTKELVVRPAAASRRLMPLFIQVPSAEQTHPSVPTLGNIGLPYTPNNHLMVGRAAQFAIAAVHITQRRSCILALTVCSQTQALPTTCMQYNHGNAAASWFCCF